MSPPSTFDIKLTVDHQGRISTFPFSTCMRIWCRQGFDLGAWHSRLPEIDPVKTSEILPPNRTSSHDGRPFNGMIAPCSNPANPITPPYRGAQRGVYECNIEYDGKLYSLTWSGDLNYPDLADFPVVRASEVFPVKESPDIASLRRSSVLVDFGSHSCIRRVDSQPYPIIKLAHPDAQSIALLQYEYKVLDRLALFDLPIPSFSDKPIFECGKIRGYQMKELYKLEHDEMRLRSEEIKQAVKQFHEAGYSHGDLSLSNVMKDDQGRIILIDVSCSGPIGAKIPSWVPSWAYEGATFHTGSDMKRMQSFLS